jgi:arginine repressor
MAGEPSSARQNCGRVTFLDDQDRCSLKRLVKSNRRSSIYQLTSLFNQGAKTISTFTVRREIKEMGIRGFIATRKPLVYAANRKKRFKCAKEQKY